MLFRVLAALSLIACGDASAQYLGSGSIHGNRGGGAAAAADPTPVFDFNPGETGSGPVNLTANAFAMTTVIECDARTDTATDWPCGTGGTFTESDATGNTTIGRAAPFTEAASRATWFDRLAGKRAPNTSVGEVGAGVDVSFILVASVKDIAALQYVGSKMDHANSTGYAIEITAAASLRGRVNGTAVGGYTLDTRGQWVIAELQCDSGATNGARFYVNGKLVGAAANCPATLANTVAKNFSFGCRPNGSQNDCFDGSIAYAKVQTCTGCMTSTAAQDAVAQKHAMQLMGVWPTEAVDPVPVLIQRTTPKYCDIKRDADGTTPRAQSFVLRVGSNWMCVGNRQEASGDGYTIVDGERHIGYFAEPNATNLLLQSDTYGTTWTKLTAADTVTSNPGVLSPSQEDNEVDRLSAAADAVGVEHGLRQTTSANLNANFTYIFSVYAGWLDDGSDSLRYLWLRNNTIGANAVAFFDLDNCAVRTTGSALKSFGTVVNQGTKGAARIRHMGDVGIGSYRWCRAEIVFQGTAAAHDLDIGASSVDGTTTQTTSSNQRVLLLWGSQLERMAVAEGESSTNAGERSSSYIPTTTATGSREVDQLRFATSNWPAAGGTILTSYLLEDGRVSGTPDDFTTARTISTAPVMIEFDADDYIFVEQTAETSTYKYGASFSMVVGGVQQWAHASTAFPNGRYQHRDGRFHSWRVVLFDDDARTYIDGETSPGLSVQSAFTLATGASGGVSIGYAHETNVEYARGLISRVAFYDVEVDDNGEAVE
jgi:hypothetical protein